MRDATWCRLLDATRFAHRTQNQLYRLAALGVVQTRRDDGGRLQFLVADLERLAKKGTKEAVPA
jgi:hypothetical protein